MQERQARRQGFGRFEFRHSLLATLLLLGVGLAGPASAAEQSAARKMGRGLAAITCGFLEIPGHIVQTTEQSGAAYGFSLGFAKGLGGFVVRELVGVYEFLSAPIEAPDGFRPILTPEFPWGYFD